MEPQYDVIEQMTSYPLTEWFLTPSSIPIINADEICDPTVYNMTMFGHFEFPSI